MIIKPSTMLRNKCREVSRLAKERGEPIFLTLNGESDIVIMSMELWEEINEMLKIIEYKKLLSDSEK